MTETPPIPKPTQRVRAEAALSLPGVAAISPRAQADRAIEDAIAHTNIAKAEKALRDRVGEATNDAADPTSDNTAGK